MGGRTTQIDPNNRSIIFFQVSASLPKV